MKLKTAFACIGVACCLAFASGCQNSAAPGDIDALSKDANGNGYLDVDPPEGIEFLTIDNLNIRLVNSVDADDVAMLASQYGIDPSLLALATITVDFTVTMDYGDGITDVLHQTEPVEPFDMRFEVACPLSARVDVSVKASAPIVGDMDIMQDAFEMTEGFDYECGDAIGYETYVDDRGNVGVNVL